MWIIYDLLLVCDNWLFMCVIEVSLRFDYVFIDWVGGVGEKIFGLRLGSMDWV